MEQRAGCALTDLCLLQDLGRGDKFLEELAGDLGAVLGVRESEICLRLQKLAQAGLLEAFAWESPEGDRFFYRITDLGRRRCADELAAWQDFRGRVDAFLLPNRGAAVV